MNAHPQKPADSKFHCACGPGDLSATTNQQFHLVRLPDGPLTHDCFKLAVAAIPEPKDGEVLLKTRFMSVDAANRAWMQGATYRDALGAGTVMAARGVGEVVESRHPDFKAGDLAFGDCGWQEYAALPGKSLMKQPQVTPLSHLLSVYGVSGLTAYFGLTEVGQAKAGETVVISAAAGAVGTFAGQIAKILGCRVVGIAGRRREVPLADGPARLRRGRQLQVGSDRRQSQGRLSGRHRRLLRQRRRRHPRDRAFPDEDARPRGLLRRRVHLRRRLAAGARPARRPVPVRGEDGCRMHGFIVSDFFGRRDEALAQLRSWVDERTTQGHRGHRRGVRQPSRRSDRTAARQEPRQADGQDQLMRSN